MSQRNADGDEKVGSKQFGVRVIAGNKEKERGREGRAKVRVRVRVWKPPTTQ